MTDTLLFFLEGNVQLAIVIPGKGLKFSDTSIFSKDIRTDQILLGDKNISSYIKRRLETSLKGFWLNLFIGCPCCHQRLFERSMSASQHLCSRHGKNLSDLTSQHQHDLINKKSKS